MVPFWMYFQVGANRLNKGLDEGVEKEVAGFCPEHLKVQSCLFPDEGHQKGQQWSDRDFNHNPFDPHHRRLQEGGPVICPFCR